MDDMSGKILTVTGGTGSFGNALVDRFMKTKFKEIRVFSRDESKQENMRMRLYGDDRIKYFIGDVRDRDSLLRVFRGSDYVFHAAALKQVPSCEFHPMEALATNTQGTANVIKAAIICDVQHVVLLSTDKAVYPINAMGISKAMAEKIMIAESRLLNDEQTKLSIVRYGNVMASRGSVIPLFVRQIQSARPFSITDPNMTRFLMSLEDAVDLVLHAFSHAQQGDLFVRKAPAATIGDLAQAMAELFNVPLNVKLIGVRHGEKLYETLIAKEEMIRAEDAGRYYRVFTDDRDLNYDKYFISGKQNLLSLDDYTSHNTQRLDVEAVKKLLLGLDFIRNMLDA